MWLTVDREFLPSRLCRKHQCEANTVGESEKQGSLSPSRKGRPGKSSEGSKKEAIPPPPTPSLSPTGSPLPLTSRWEWQRRGPRRGAETSWLRALFPESPVLRLLYLPPQVATTGSIWPGARSGADQAAWEGALEGGPGNREAGRPLQGRGQSARPGGGRRLAGPSRSIGRRGAQGGSGRQPED